MLSFISIGSVGPEGVTNILTDTHNEYTQVNLLTNKLSSSLHTAISQFVKIDQNFRHQNVIDR